MSQETRKKNCTKKKIHAYLRGERFHFTPDRVAGPDKSMSEFSALIYTYILSEHKISPPS
jgi:hypothetical protein